MSSHAGCRHTVTPTLPGSGFVLCNLTKRRKRDPTHFYSSGAGRRTPSIPVPLVRSLWKRQKDVRLAVPPRTLLLPLGEGWDHFSQAAPLTGESTRREAAAFGRKPKRDPGIHYLWALFPFSLSFTFPDGSPDLSSIAQVWPGTFSRGYSEEPFSAGTSPAEPLLREDALPSAAIFSILFLTLPAFPGGSRHWSEIPGIARAL